jgi:hypothetical protein
MSDQQQLDDDYCDPCIPVNEAADRPFRTADTPIEMTSLTFSYFSSEQIDYRSSPQDDKCFVQIIYNCFKR